MKMIFENIKKYIRTNFLIYTIMILCQVTTVLVIILLHGFYYNARIINENTLYVNDEDVFQFYFLSNDKSSASNTEGEQTTPTQEYGEIQLYDFFKAMNLMDETAKTGFEGFFFEADYQDGGVDWSLDFHLQYLKEYGTFGFYQTALDNIEKNEIISSGRMITQEEIVSGANVAVIGQSRAEELGLKVGSVLNFLGTDYKIIGLDSMSINTIIVPWNTLPDILISPKWIGLQMDKMMTTKTYNGIKQAFHAVFGDTVTFTDIPTIDNTEVRYYKTVMAIIALICCIAAIDLAVLYCYILGTRRKQLAIFRIAGCSKSRARRLYLAEMLLSATFLYGLTALLYRFVLTPPLEKIMPYLSDAYDWKTYLILYGIYIGMIYLVINAVIFAFVRKTPVALLKARAA